VGLFDRLVLLVIGVLNARAISFLEPQHGSFHEMLGELTYAHLGGALGPVATDASGVSGFQCGA
jgi:hypothetical protein